MSKRNKTPTNQHHDHFSIRNIRPITKNQQVTFDEYWNGRNLFLHGMAGTGKTYISLFLALKDILSRDGDYKRIIIVRSAVPSRDQGFMPGNLKEKSRMYEDPYKEICDDLFGRGDGYEILKMKKLVEFTTTSYLRGMTFNDSIIIADEIQNFSFQECNTLITRVGNNSKIIFCGDLTQDDLTSERKKEYSGINDFTKIIKRMNAFSFVEFGTDDIVRSDLVKEYLIEKYNLGL